MNEQEQAGILARWLEDPAGDLPEGLDADVVESIIALKPELAPPPTLSVEDILSGVTQGPFVNLMPVGASVGAAPGLSPQSGSSSRGRPWWIAIAGVGGLSSIAAAALVAIGLGVGGVFLAADPASQSENATLARSPAAVADGVAQIVDTGARAGEGAMDEGAVVAAKSRPARELSAKPTPDAVASAADLKYFDDAADGEVESYGFVGDVDRATRIPEVGRGARSGADRPLAGALSEPPPPPLTEPSPSARPRLARPGHVPEGAANPEARENIPEAEPLEEVEQTRRASDEAMAGAPASSEDVSSDRRSISGERKRAKKERSKAEKAKKDRRATAKAAEHESEAVREDAAPLEVPIPIPGAPVSTGSGGPSPPAVGDAIAPAGATAKHGATGATDEAITAARAALQAGDPAAAIAACDRGLATHTGATRVRQMLLALKGDAFLGQSNQAAAEQLWQQAREIRNALAAP